MFDIKTARDFHAKLVDELDAHIEDPGSTRHAINCALTAFHMLDWIWVDFLEKDKALQAKLGLPLIQADLKAKGEKHSEIRAFRAYVDSMNPFFRTVQGIANGSKHFRSDVPVKTSVTGAIDAAAFQSDAFDVKRLLVDVGETSPDYRLVHQFLEFACRSWTEFLETYGPYKGQLKKSRFHVD